MGHRSGSLRGITGRAAFDDIKVEAIDAETVLSIVSSACRDVAALDWT